MAKPMSNKIKVLDDIGYIELLGVMGSDKSIVDVARVSHNTGDKYTPEDDSRLLRQLYNWKHTTPFEMVTFRMLVKCPLFVARQWMRHRTWTYVEQSRRYSAAPVEFYIPLPEDSPEFAVALNNYCVVGLQQYNRAIIDGVPLERARFFLPVNMYTTFSCSVDAHNLMHFLRLRMARGAQYETRQYAIAICEHIFSEVLPGTYRLFKEEMKRK